MASQINASNSGFGGIVSTGDSSGELQLQTAGTTAVTIDTSQNVGIGTTSPTQKLQVYTSAGSGGQIQITNSSTGATSTDGVLIGYDGSNDVIFNNQEATQTKFYTSGTERMRIDSSGRVTTPYQTAFRAYATNSINYTTGDTKIQVHDVAVYNVGNNYSTSTFRFTAPVAGVYMFVARAWAQSGNTSEAAICFKKNGTVVGVFRVGSAPGGFFSLQPVTTVYLNVNDYVELFTEAASASGVVHTSSGDANSMFAGYLLG